MLIYEQVLQSTPVYKVELRASFYKIQQFIKLTVLSALEENQEMSSYKMNTFRVY